MDDPMHWGKQSLRFLGVALAFVVVMTLFKPG